MVKLTYKVKRNGTWIQQTAKYNSVNEAQNEAKTLKKDPSFKNIKISTVRKKKTNNMMKLLWGR